MTTADDIEVWKSVPGFPAYAASTWGRLKRIGLTGGRKRARAPTGRILGGKAKSGYILASVYRDGMQFSQGMHTVICSTFHGRRPSLNHEVAHGDGVRDNNRWDNLRWATRKENCADKWVHGTVPTGDNHHARLRPERLARGERNGGGGKLTADDIPKIRADPRLHREIGADYGIVKSMVAMIKRRETWKHIP